MSRAIWRALILVLVVCATGRAEEKSALLHYSESDPHSEYQAVSGSVSATIRHPFKVIRFLSEKIQGTLLIDADNLEHGFSLQTTLEANAWSCSFPRLQSLWTEVFPPQAKEVISFESRSGRLIDRIGERFTLDLFPEIQIRGVKSNQPLFASCDRDAQVIKCSFSGGFSLSALGIPVPRHWGVTAKDGVEVEGEIAWVPASAKTNKIEAPKPSPEERP